MVLAGQSGVLGVELCSGVLKQHPVEHQRRVRTSLDPTDHVLGGAPSLHLDQQLRLVIGSGASFYAQVIAKRFAHQLGFKMGITAFAQMLFDTELVHLSEELFRGVAT